MLRIALTAIAVLTFLSGYAASEEVVQPRRMGDLVICPNGYRLDSGACRRIHVPDNAQAIGDQWYCKSGFRRIGDTCHAFAVPPNAHAIGDRWACDIGFRQSGENCVKVSWEELRALAEQFGRQAVRSASACKKVCDQYSSDKPICHRFCEGE